MTTVILLLGIALLVFLRGLATGVKPARELPQLPPMMPTADKVRELKAYLQKQQEQRRRVTEGLNRLSVICLLIFLVALWILSLYGWPMPWSWCAKYGFELP